MIWKVRISLYVTQLLHSLWIHCESCLTHICCVCVCSINTSYRSFDLQLSFGPDGCIYASIGDKSKPNNVQKTNQLHGVIIRVRPDGTKIVALDPTQLAQ